MRRSQRAFSDARRFSRAAGSSGLRRAGSLAGQPNFSRLVLTNETLSPSFLNLTASTLISGSLSEKYSFRLPGGLRISTNWSPY